MEDWWKYQNLRKAEILLAKYMKWKLEELGEAYLHHGIYINKKDYTLKYAKTDEDPFPGAQPPQPNLSEKNKIKVDFGTLHVHAGTEEKPVEVEIDGEEDTDRWFELFENASTGFLWKPLKPLKESDAVEIELHKRTFESDQTGAGSKNIYVVKVKNYSLLPQTVEWVYSRGDDTDGDLLTLKFKKKQDKDDDDDDSAEDMAKVKAVFENICRARGKRGNSLQKSFSALELEKFEGELDKVNVNLYVAINKMDRNVDGSVSFEEFKKAYEKYDWVKNLVDSIVFKDNTVYQDSSSRSSLSSTVNRHAKPLDEAEEKQVDKEFNRTDNAEITRIGGRPISVKDFQRLKKDTFLNDEIVNACMHMLQVREEKSIGSDAQRVYFLFSEFFGYKEKSSLQEYQRKRFEQNKSEDLEWIVIPVHRGENWLHWSSYYVNIKDGRIFYLDSLGNSSRKQDIDRIKYWLKERGVEERDNWNVIVLEVPQQIYNDCGVFTIMFAVYFTDPNNFADLRALQQVQPNLCNSLFRKRIGLYLLDGKID